MLVDGPLQLLLDLPLREVRRQLQFSAQVDVPENRRRKVDAIKNIYNDYQFFDVFCVQKQFQKAINFTNFFLGDRNTDPRI
jgi:hypothetical protein